MDIETRGRNICNAFYNEFEGFCHPSEYKFWPYVNQAGLIRWIHDELKWQKVAKDQKGKGTIGWINPKQR